MLRVNYFPGSFKTRNNNPGIFLTQRVWQGGRMKKIFLLIVFCIICAGAAFAQEPQLKTFEIGDGGIVKIAPEGSLLVIQIIYNKVSDAPKPVQERFRAVAPYERTEYVPLQFSIRFLNEDGAEVCRELLFFNDFILDETDEQPKAVLQFQSGGQCGIYSYSKISSVAVDYNSIRY